MTGRRRTRRHARRSGIRADQTAGAVTPQTPDPTEPINYGPKTFAEVIELGQKLASIFMPHATARRVQAIAEQRRFVHYTSADAAIKIIRSKMVWMRNATCMTDYSEVQHGFHTLNRQPNLRPLIEAIDQAVAGVGTEAVQIFNHWWADTQFQTYLMSLSEHYLTEDRHGRLSMWRAFGQSGPARVALVLRLPLHPTSALSLSILFSPVAYFADETLNNELAATADNVRQNAAFLQTANRVHLVATVFHMLLLAVLCLKHEGFREEREWRAVYSPNRMASEHITPSIETVAGIPQTVYRIPLTGPPPDDLAELTIAALLDRAIIGPTQYPMAIWEALHRALVEAGVPNPETRIVVSGIPIRT
jgi:hypothetical protein